MALQDHCRGTGRVAEKPAPSRAGFEPSGAWRVLDLTTKKVVASRDDLEQRVTEIERRFAGVEDVPLPPFWGGYRIVATSIEFWQGQASRLHDRVRYTFTSGAWTRVRLGP